MNTKDQFKVRTIDLQRFRRELSHRIHYTRSREFKRAKQWLALELSNVVCDVGCGDGYWTSRLASSSRRVIGVDVDFNSLERAKRHYGRQVDFVLASAECLPFDTNSVDKLTSVCAIEHFHDDRQAMREMARVLRSGGRLCISLDSLSLPSISAEYKVTHARKYDVKRLYDHEGLRLSLSECGLHPLSIGYIGTSDITSGLVQFQVGRGWRVNYLAPLSLLVSRFADAVVGKHDSGLILFAAAKKGR